MKTLKFKLILDSFFFAKKIEPVRSFKHMFKHLGFIKGKKKLK